MLDIGPGRMIKRANVPGLDPRIPRPIYPFPGGRSQTEEIPTWLGRPVNSEEINLLLLRLSALRFGDPTYQRVVDVVCFHFQSLYKCRAWKEIGVEHVLILLLQSGLRIKSENTVYKAAINWLDHDAENREVHMLSFDVLRRVKFPYMKVGYLKKIKKTKHFVNNSALLQLVNDAIWARRRKRKAAIPLAVNYLGTYQFTSRDRKHCIFTSESNIPFRAMKGFRAPPGMDDQIEFDANLKRVDQDGVYRFDPNSDYIEPHVKEKLAMFKRKTDEKLMRKAARNPEFAAFFQGQHPDATVTYTYKCTPELKKFD